VKQLICLLVLLAAAALAPLAVSGTGNRRTDLLALDLQVAACADWPLEGYVEPQTDVPPTFPPRGFWIWWYWRYMENQLPPGHRVYCGVTCPEFSADRDLAAEVADDLDVSYSTSDTAEDICNLIVAEYWDEIQ